jgi:hypothetical protein
LLISLKNVRKDVKLGGTNMFKIIINYDEMGNLVSQTQFDEFEIEEFQRKFKSDYDENELLTNSVIMELIIQRLAKCGYTYDDFKRNEEDYISKSQEITRQIFNTAKKQKPNSIFRKIHIICEYINESMEILLDKKDLFNSDKSAKTLYDILFAIERTLKSHIDRLYIDYRYLMESEIKIKNIITTLMSISNENIFDDIITPLINANKIICDIAKKLLYF